MRTTSLLKLVLAVAALAGCVTKPQLQIALTQETLASPGKIGVAMTKLPKQDVQVPGADCLLCQLAAAEGNAGLIAHTQTLSYGELPNLKNKTADLLRKKGATVVVIDEIIDLETLPEYDGYRGGENLTRKNFSSIQKKYGIDKLMIIEINALGFIRNYFPYKPISDPRSLLAGTGYIIDLNKHTYVWFKRVYISKSAGPTWDEPPKYPSLTNAYFKTLEMSTDEFLKAIANPSGKL